MCISLLSEIFIAHYIKVKRIIEQVKYLEKQLAKSTRRQNVEVIKLLTPVYVHQHFDLLTHTMYTCMPAYT